jgi:hypothetical protein
LFSINKSRFEREADYLSRAFSAYHIFHPDPVSLVKPDSGESGPEGPTQKDNERHNLFRAFSAWNISTQLDAHIFPA